MESGATSDMLRHFHGLYSHRPQLSTNQRARIHSVIVKKLVAYNNPILFSPRPFSFRLKCINCCDNCDDPIFISICISRSHFISAPFCTSDAPMKKKSYHSRRKVGQLWPCVFSLSSTSYCLWWAFGDRYKFTLWDRKLWRHSKSCRGLSGRYSDHSSTNQLSLKFVKMCQRK